MWYKGSMRLPLVLFALIASCATQPDAGDAEPPDVSPPELPDALQPELPDVLGPELPDALQSGQDATVSETIAVQFEVLGSLPIASHGMTVGTAGEYIYISDSFSPNRRGIFKCPLAVFQDFDCFFFRNPDFATPSGMTTFASRIYVSDAGSGQIVVFQESDFNDTNANVAVPAVWNTERIADQFYSVTNQGRLFRFDQGPPELLFDGLHAPFDLAPADNGSIWVSQQNGNGSDDGSIVKIDSTGEIVISIQDGMENPEGLASDGRGGVWVAETQRNELRLYNSEGELLWLDETNTDIPVALEPIPGSDDLILFNVGTGTVVRVLVTRS